MTKNKTKNEYKARFSELGLQYHYSGKLGRGFARRPDTVSNGRMFYGAPSPDINKIILDKFKRMNPETPNWAIR